MQIVQCSICQSSEHLVSEFPTTPVVREMFMEQTNPVDLLNTPTILHFQIPLIQGGSIIRIYLGRVDKDNSLLTCKLFNIKFHR